MGVLAAALRLAWNGGPETDGALAQRSGAAVARAIAALSSLAALGCAAPTGPPDTALEDAHREARSAAEAGLTLYEGGEMVLAGQRFATAVAAAERAGDAELARAATAAQCAAWLHARRLERFAACGAQLERFERSARRTDPGTNTLLAFAAIAGGRPLPPFALPPDVRRLVRAAAAGRP